MAAHHSEGRLTMPYSFKHAREGFSLTLDGETPVGQVERFGGGAWLLCCPVCGCTHDVTGKPDGTTVQPTCTASKLAHLYAPIRAKWLKEHPTVAGYSAVKLAYIQPAVIIPFANLLPDTASERKAA